MGIEASVFARFLQLCFACFAFLLTCSIGLNPKIDNLPRYKTRKGGGKKKSDSDDLLALYVFLDKNAVSLPTFVAARLNKLPSVKPEDADVYTLTSTVSTLRQQVHQVVDQLKLVQSAVSQPASVIKGHSVSEVQNYDGMVGLPAMSAGSPGMSLYQAAFPALSAAAGKKTCQPLQQVIPMQYLLANSVELSGRCPRENTTPTSLEAKLLTAN